MVKVQTYDKKKDNSYIVLLHDHVQVNKDNYRDWLSTLLSNDGVENTLTGITHAYKPRFFHGFTGEFNRLTVEALCASKDVKCISENGIMKLNVDQPDAPWGISRISQQAGHGAQVNAGGLNFTYRYNNADANIVDVYVVDSGIQINHGEFENRATWGRTILDGAVNNNDQTDESGHGTHCAGIIGGRGLGVAKNVALIAVKVTVLIDDDPPRHGVMTDDLMQGLEWVWEQVPASGRVRVVSISIGNRIFVQPEPEEVFPLEVAINSLIGAGIHVVVAAGNDNIDVINEIPARFLAPITVGASDIQDRRWVNSNWGPGVDIFAPGAQIRSAGINQEDLTATAVMWGTSMACPHVSGLVAYLINLHGDMPPAAMKTFLNETCLEGVLQGPLGEGSPNRLARNDVNNPRFPVN